MWRIPESVPRAGGGCAGIALTSVLVSQDIPPSVISGWLSLNSPLPGHFCTDKESEVREVE